MIIKIIITILTFSLALIGINAIIPWPDIPQDIFTVAADIFDKIWYFNKYVAIDTLFARVALIILVEICLLLWSLGWALYSIYTGTGSWKDLPLGDPGRKDYYRDSND